MSDTTMVTLVRDLGDEYTLVQDSQGVLAILSDIGVVNYTELDDGEIEASIDYRCLFIKVGDGEYEEIWGCVTYIPWLDCPVYRLK